MIKVKRAKPKIIICNIPTSIPEDIIKKKIFRKYELDIEWSKFDEECVLKFRTGAKGKELCNWKNTNEKKIKPRLANG